MNAYLLAASIITVLLLSVHSILGEILIFNRIRKPGKIIPTKRADRLGEWHFRIIWACWHIMTVMGFGVAAIIYTFSSAEDLQTSVTKIFILKVFTVLFFISGIIILIGTKGKHAGWFFMLLIAVLIYIGIKS